MRASSRPFPRKPGLAEIRSRPGRRSTVDPPHRGHRLGLIAKIANLRYALDHEPDLRCIDTWNSTVNGYMIAINEALGFRPVDAWVNWQQDLTRG